MSALLFDPLHAPPGAWPESRQAERSYIEGMARDLSSMVSNVRTRWRALRSAERLYPVTVNDGEYGDSYVCLPHSAYVLYGRRELELVDLGAVRWPLTLGLHGVDALLRAVAINRIVHVDNWLLSTNLHGDWDGSDARQVREALHREYPRHLVAVRSVDPWSSPQLEAALRNDGWLMLPSRQVWVTDSPDSAWSQRSAVYKDRRLLARSPLAVEDLVAMRPGDAQRISALYRQLYIDKYSRLNPAFTAAWIEWTHATGLLKYRVARDPGGRILAAVGSWVRGGILTPPVVGYDTSRPAREGLYRIASYLYCEQAQALGVRINGSAGAAHFKRLRGAAPVIECTALWTGGLAAWQRRLLDGFAELLWRAVVPVMRKKQL